MSGTVFLVVVLKCLFFKAQFHECLITKNLMLYFADASVSAVIHRNMDDPQSSNTTDAHAQFQPAVRGAGLCCVRTRLPGVSRRQPRSHGRVCRALLVNTPSSGQLQRG